MRITTQLLYQSAVGRLNDQQSALLRTQQEIATGRRIVTPADDPVAAAQALGLTTADARTLQFAANRDAAKNALGQQEGALASVGNLIQDVQTAVVAAGNATWSDSERQFLATELRGRLAELTGLANTLDADGQALFGGYASDGPPFASIGGSVQFQGDGGARSLQVAAGRQMPVTASGQAIFEAIRTGNGRFTASAAAANTGSGVVGPGTVSDTAQLNGHAYQVSFSVVAGVTTYAVNDLTAGTTLSTGNAYTAGDAIEFGGMRFAVSGAPADGDAVDVAPSPNQSVFKTLENLIGALEIPLTGDAGRARLQNSLASASNNLSNALDNVLGARAAVGSRLVEIDSLDNAGEDLHLQYQQTLSSLQDTDYNEALSRLSRQQLGLEAAQQSFARIAGLSLFNYL